MVFNLAYPEFNGSIFKKCEWENFYWGGEEEIPPNSPTHCNKKVELCGYVNSDYAGKKLTWRSRSGYFVFINTSLVQWFSKRQSTIEMSMFGT